MLRPALIRFFARVPPATPSAWRAWRARRRRYEAVQIEREVERRRRYYCRRSLAGLEGAVAALEADLGRASLADLLALAEGA
ncbi:MAG: hypothetical protein R3181_15625 [Rubricoccaceae bacterium]|nr:hypothetical protein [Rubricoccaceae bacterium]